MPLREPYSVAYETVSEVINVFLEITTDKGFRGFGCAAPDREVCGENPADVLEAVERIAKPLLLGQEARPSGPAFDELTRALQHRPSTLAMLDMALHDLEAKAYSMPLYRWLGGRCKGVLTSVTIGILPPEETVDRARLLVGRGFRCLKLKGGKDPDDDAYRALQVRKAVGPHVELRFDANQGFTVQETLAFVRKTQDAHLTMIEQPTPRSRPELLAEIAAQVDIPIMADESVVTLNDARIVTSNHWADMINVKLMKVGGIAMATRMDDLARAAGIAVMAGCMDDAALGIAAAVHWVLARPNVRYADLDGHFDLVNDPSAGAVTLKDGLLYPTDKAGLGFELEVPKMRGRGECNEPS